LAESGVFGETLRRAREARGLALDAVASATRIAHHHLEALERGDLESLPTGPFGRSYLRSYAEFLGIDPEPILDSYRLTESDKRLGLADRSERAIRELSRVLERRPERKRFRLGPVLFALVTGSALLMAVWVSREPAEEPRPQVVQKGPSEVEEPPPVSEPPTTPVGEPDRDRPTAMTVSGSAVGTGIVDHSLVGRADRFNEGDRVAFWTRVLAAKPGDVIHHYWFHEGRAVMRRDLTIGGPHWRTYSRYTLPEGSRGSWVVEARDGTGRVLARADFLCLERAE
jgi:transcriptional regulator with XRE-family HTH domain